MINRWGTDIRKGQIVTVRDAYHGVSHGPFTIEKVETKGAYARAYGPRVILDNGASASIDDVQLVNTTKRNPRAVTTRGELQQMGLDYLEYKKEGVGVIWNIRNDKKIFEGPTHQARAKLRELVGEPLTFPNPRRRPAMSSAATPASGGHSLSAVMLAAHARAVAPKSRATKNRAAMKSAGIKRIELQMKALHIGGSSWKTLRDYPDTKAGLVSAKRHGKIVHGDAPGLSLRIVRV